MLRLVMDCADAEDLAAFWAPALGYRKVGAAGQYVLLRPKEGAPGPDLVLQEVSEPKTGKNRLHLDIRAVDIEAEAVRMMELGATRLSPGQFEEYDEAWIVMADPEGNEFCVCTRR